MNLKLLLASGLVVAVFAALKLPVISPVAAQSTPPIQTPTFRGRLDLVRTEVAVIDNKTGKVVTGLTERDFTISENGTKQAIVSFVDESRPTEDVAPRGDAQAAVPGQSRRVFLFVLTPSNWGDGPYKSFEGVAAFIRTRLRPNDLAGLMASTRLTPLTTDHERIAAIVDRLKVIPNAVADEVRQIRFRNPRGGQEAQHQIETIMDRWLDGENGPGFFKAAAGYLIGTPEYRWNDDADIIRNWSGRLAGNEVLKVVAGIEYLRSVEGEKHLMLFTIYGFNPPVRISNEGIGLHYYSAEDDRRLAARANDAGVAIDIVQTIGAGVGAAQIMSPMNVSQESGGQFTGNRTAPQQLARIDEASRNGYILGYQPSNPALDGKYRDIKVAVNRKDVTVIYRRGYTAKPDPDPVDAREFYSRARMRDAAVGNSDFNDIRVKASAGPGPNSGSVRQVAVKITIDISTLPLVERAGKWEGDIDLLVLCGDARQNVVGKIDQRMTLSMSREMYEQAKAGGIPYSTNIPVSSQATVMKVIVFNFESDRLGTASAAIR